MLKSIALTLMEANVALWRPLICGGGGGRYRPNFDCNKTSNYITFHKHPVVCVYSRIYTKNALVAPVRLAPTMGSAEAAGWRAASAAWPA